VRISSRTEQEKTTGAQSRNELVLPYCPNSTRPEANNSRKGEVWGVDKGLLMGDTFRGRLGRRCQIRRAIPIFRRNGSILVMSPARAAAGIALVISLVAPQSSRATAFEEFLAALSRGDSAAMRSVVSRNRDEMAEDFFLLLREASSTLDGASYDSEERNKARLLVFAAAQLAAAFDSANPDRDLLFQQVQGSPLLTTAVRSSVYSDAALAQFLSQRAEDLASPGFGAATSISRDLRSIFDAAGEPPEARLRRMQERYEARARQELEEAIAEQRKQRELSELSNRIKRLLRARDADGLLSIATDASLPVEARRRAIAALGETDSRQAALSLGPLLHNESMRDAVVGALAALGSVEAAAALASRLDDDPIAAKAMPALVQISEPNALPPLFEKLRDPQARGRAIETLSAIWGSSARERWLQLVRREPQVETKRFLATCALLAAEDASAVAPLAGFLADGPLEEEALRKLSELGGATAIEILIHQLDDPGTATAAGEALGRIGAPAFPALLRRSGQLGPGRRLAAETLAVAGYRPRSSREEADLLLVRQATFRLLGMGSAALPSVASALRRREPGAFTTALVVVMIEMGTLVTVLGLALLFQKRRWLRPDFEAKVSAGRRTRLAGVVREPAKPDGEPGTIISTAWARDFLGRRRRIKVETLVPVKPQRDRKKLTRAEDKSQQNPLDLLVVAGASVRPGTYLAIAPAGSVKIQVIDKLD
jgi:hypothetical protein